MHIGQKIEKDVNQIISLFYPAQYARGTLDMQFIAGKFQVEYLLGRVGYLNPAVCQDSPGKGLFFVFKNHSPEMIFRKCNVKDLPFFLPFPLKLLFQCGVLSAASGDRQ
jgi:hypothetical protein